MPMLESSPSAAARDPQAPNSMFGNYTAAKLRKAPPWAGPVLAAAALLHIVVFAAMWAKSIWALEQLDKPKSNIDLAVAPPPPPPPPPPPGGAKPQEVQVTQKKVKVKDVVQPEKVEKQEHTPVPEAGDANGVEGGVEGGDPNGVADGVLGAPPPPPPPPPPAPPQIVPPTLLEGSRIAGDKIIVPDDVTKTEIQRSGKDRIIGSFRLCLTVEGSVSSVNTIKQTGFPAYDGKIAAKIRSEWRYKPYMVNGKAVPVCTAVTFIYSQK
jgi:protein TonB